LQITLFYPPLIAWAVFSLCLLLSPLQAQELHITLLNGDCDGDNEVTLLDFGIVVNAFGSTPNDPNWDPRADLDAEWSIHPQNAGNLQGMSFVTSDGKLMAYYSPRTLAPGEQEPCPVTIRCTVHDENPDVSHLTTVRDIGEASFLALTKWVPEG
jgi:hypothetical protein